MTQVNVHEAKTHLSRLIRAALDGEDVVIAKDNRPLVRLEVLPEARRTRQLGAVRELIVRMDEGFDAPLDDFAAYSAGGGLEDAAMYTLESLVDRGRSRGRRDCRHCPPKGAE